MLLKWISSRKVFKNTDKHVLFLGNQYSMSVISREYYSRPGKPKRTNDHIIEINNLSSKFNYTMKNEISLSFFMYKKVQIQNRNRKSVINVTTKTIKNL